MTLTFDLQSQAKLGQGQPHAKYQGHRSNGLRWRARTNGRTLPNILSPCYVMYAIDNDIPTGASILTICEIVDFILVSVFTGRQHAHRVGDAKDIHVESDAMDDKENNKSIVL